MGYTGHKFDKTLGLSYMQTRYYDPVIGRFYGNDPVGILEHLDGTGGIQGFNRFGYANNNPYRYTDPDGKSPKDGDSSSTLAGVILDFALGDEHKNNKNRLKLAEAKRGVGERGKKAAKKVDKLKPGEFATESIPARGPKRNFTKPERDQVNEIGARDGCHTCGSKTAGTKSGNFIPDHQPPNALNTSGGPQKLFPHCKSCSQSQAGQVTQEKRRRRL